MYCGHKHVQEPYLTYLLSGEKTVEGRIPKPNTVWSVVKPGDTVTFTDIEDKKGLFLVIGITIAKNFEDLYVIHKENLLPEKIDNVWDDVYSQFGNTEEDVNKYGVIGVCVKRIE